MGLAELEARLAALESKCAACERRRKRRRKMGFDTTCVGGGLAAEAYEQDPDAPEEPRPQEECTR